MKIRRIISAFFSPTGGTKKVAMAFQEFFITCPDADGIELLSFNCLTPLQRATKTPAFSKNDLVIFCSPVLKGRMPAALADWPELEGNGADALVVSVYGNRAVEDAARETMAMLQDHGFRIIGRVDAVAEHSQDRSLAAGRPDAQDKKDFAAIAQRLLDLYKEDRELPELEFDRTTPLKETLPFPGVPEPAGDLLCDKCGRCHRVCPMGIIDPETNRVAPENRAKCIACRACMSVCRKSNRDFAPEIRNAIAARMAEVRAANSERKPVALTLP